MSIMSSDEKQKKSERKEERAQAFKKFKEDMKASFCVWIKLDIAISVGIILLYLMATFILKWDLFYETDLKYGILLVISVSFAGLVFVCWGVARFLYKTKHKRNTKYK